MPQTQRILIDIAKDKKRKCVERGEAVVSLLVDWQIDQQRLPALTGLTSEMVSKLKVSYDNLGSEARKLCRTLDMHIEACYLLVQKVPQVDQVEVIKRAQNYTVEREAESSRKVGPRGRQSPKGTITKGDMQWAIWDWNGD